MKKYPKALPYLSIHIDGAARGNPGPAGAGILLAETTGRMVKEMGVFLGEATNNVAESMALILALQEALLLGRRRVSVFTDSELLARQVQGKYKVRDARLQWLHVLIQSLLRGFEVFAIAHLPREKNRKADRLANRAILEALRRQPPGTSRALSPPVDTRQATFW